MTLADSNYSIEQALSEYSRASVEEVRKLVKKMTLGDYIALANALDASDDAKITELVDKYDFEQKSEKTVEENAPMDQQLKNTIAKLAQKPVTSVKAPTMVNTTNNQNETIVSADDKSKTIATANDKGEVTIHDASKPEVKKQISLESQLSDLRRLTK